MSRLSRRSQLSLVPRFVSTALPLMAVAMLLNALSTPVLAAYIVTCTTPTRTGDVIVTGVIGGNVTLVNGAYTQTVNITTSDTDVTKCKKIANALNSFVLGQPFSAVASGNTVIVSDSLAGYLSNLTIAFDNTHEDNRLTVSLNPGQKVQFAEVPNANQTVVPPGTTFGVSILESTGGTVNTLVNATVGANGIQTEAALLGLLNAQITAELGPFTEIATIPDSPLIEFLTAPLDPTTVSVIWNANTSLDLANFGLQIVPAAAPEPATLALLGIGIAGLGFARRKRTQ